MIETTVSQRKDLEAERQRKETEEQRKAREVSRYSPSILSVDLTFYYRSLSHARQLLRAKSHPCFAHSIVSSATSSSKTSHSTTSIPTPTATTTKHVYGT